MSGKGSKPRPYSVDQKTFSDNWEKIFGSKDRDLAYESDNPLERPIEVSSNNGSEENQEED
jgi:hypothetical protein